MGPSAVHTYVLSSAPGPSSWGLRFAQARFCTCELLARAGSSQVQNRTPPSGEAPARGGAWSRYPVLVNGCPADRSFTSTRRAPRITREAAPRDVVALLFVAVIIRRSYYPRAKDMVTTCRPRAADVGDLTKALVL